MSSNTVRTVVIFGIIALVLGGVTVGGLRLMKARNDAYASGQTQQTATNTTKQPAVAQPKQEAKQNETKNNNPTSTTPIDQGKVADAPKPTPTPAPSQTQPAASQPAATPPAPNAKKTDTSLPATSGLSPADFFATGGLMAIAAFFGSKLLKARADYRRYLHL